MDDQIVNEKPVVVETPMDEPVINNSKLEPAIAPKAKISPKKTQPVAKKPAKLKASTKATRNKTKKK
ncbi:MAG: hypothetical protein R2877_01565 [Bdellovibrionota bacterium]